MKHSNCLDLSTLCVLVACGAAARLALHEQYPNFAPVAALALFAGFFLRDMRLAAIVPIAIMAITDYCIGAYDAVVMVSVYAALTVPVLLGPWLRKWLRLERPSVGQAGSSAALIYGCSLAGAFLFYFVTNGAEWAVDCFRDNPTYSSNLLGLMECLGAGLPFFKYTLAGDFCFATFFFGAYALAVNLGWLLEEDAEVAKA